MLSQVHNIDLDKLFTYPLSPVPWSTATADGCFCKTNKSQLLHVIEKDVSHLDVVLPSNHVYVIDGNALIRSIVHLPQTFGDFAFLQSSVACLRHRKYIL